MKRNKFQANVGRMISGTILIFILCSIQNSNSAIVNEQTLSLNSITSSGDYAARDQVILSPGFHGTASSTEAGIHIYTNPHMIVPTSYLPITSIPTDSRELNTNLLVGSLEGNSNVSGSGAANYTIPIPVPIGIKGMQPNLSIVYNSQVGNGLLGWGCNLGGLSAISRSVKDQYHDGVAGAPQYNTSDPLTLDGQRLIYMSEKSGYFTEIQSHSLVTTEPYGFKLKTKDGVLYRYGSLTGKLSGAQDTVLCWYLDYVEDPMGNYMRYIYEQENLCMYIKRIEYGNNVNQETNTTHYVDFYYENRKDTISINYGHFSGKMSRILYKIVSGTNNEIYRTLNLSYSKDVYSRLTSIKESAADGSSFNPTILNWEYIPEDSIVVNNISLLGSPDNSTDYINGFSYKSADYDGDGLSEIVTRCVPEGRDYARIHYFKPQISNEGTLDSMVCNNFRIIDKGANWNSMNFIQYKGKGEKEMCFSEYLSGNKNVKFTIVHNSTISGPDIVVQTKMKYGNALPVSAIGDLNNDGRDEILYIDNIGEPDNRYHHFGKYYNFADSTWHEFSLYHIGAVGGVPTKIFIKDFNADGLSDVLVFSSMGDTGCGFTIGWNQGEMLNGSTKNISFSQNMYSSIEHNNVNNDLAEIGDFNGDGLYDIFLGSGSGVACGIHLNLGNGRFGEVKNLNEILDPVFNNCGNLLITGNFVHIFDFNLDGKSDILTCNKNYNNNSANSLTTRWYKSTGSGFELVKTTISSDLTNTSDKFLKGDFNGDGRIELMNYGYDCYNNTGPTNGLKIYRNPLLTNNSGNIVSITNGYNQQVKFDYISSSNNSSSSIYSKSYYESYPITNINPGLSLVRSMKTGKDDDWDEATYQYIGAKIHVCGKGFLGFGKIVTLNERQDKKVIKRFSFDNKFFHVYPTSQSVRTYNGINSISHTDYQYNITEIGGRCILPKLTILTETDSLRNVQKVTTNTIDNSGNITAQSVLTNELGGSTVFAENTTNDYITVNDGIFPNRLVNNTITTTRTGKPAISQSVSYTYYNNGLVHTAQRNFDTSRQGFISYSYDGFGNPLSSSVESCSSTRRLTTLYEYSSDGRFPIRMTDPIGRISKQSFNAFGQLITSTTLINSLEKSTMYEYDAMGRQLKVTYPDGTINTSSIFWTTYPFGALYGAENATTGKPISKVYYDVLGRVIRNSQGRFDGSELSTEKIYDTRGRLWKVSQPFKGSNATLWNQYTYDTYDRPIQLTYASGKIDSWSYSGNNVIETKDGILTTNCYDATGHVMSVTDQAGTITYDLRSDGQPLSIIAPGNIITSFGYDGYGRQIALADPSAGLKRYEYDAEGNRCKETNALNDSTTMLYDQYNRLINKVTPEFATAYSYNSDGLIRSVISTNGTSKIYTYDDLGRVQTERDVLPENKWYQKAYTYYSGNINTILHSTQNGPITTENYLYSNGNLSEIKLNGQTSIWKLEAENSLGQPIQATTGSLLRNYGFNIYGLPTGRTVSTESAAISSQYYDFNPQTGNLNWRRDELQDSQESFSYDGLNRMVNVGGDVTDYDNKGNITGKSSIGTFQYSVSGKPYALTGVTPSGNAIPLRNQTVSYTSFMRPDSISENNNLVTFTYNDAGDRVRTRSTLGSSIICDRFYASDNYMADVNASTTKEYLYLGGDAYSAPAVYIKENGAASWNIHYICRDYLGSITHVTNSSGLLEQELSYDAWGRLRNPETREPYSPGNEPSLYLGRGYTGHEQLAEFGLINMNSRLYDPAVGRFLSPDPYVQAPNSSQNFNRYSYCMNNPLRYTDPSGNTFKDFLNDLDYSIGRFFDGIGITSVSFGYSTNGRFLGMGVSYRNHQEIIAGYSFEYNRWGIAKNYSNPYYWGSYEAMDRDIVNCINNAREEYFTNSFSTGNMLGMSDMSFGDSGIGFDLGCSVVPALQGAANTTNDLLNGAGYLSGGIGAYQIGMLEDWSSLSLSSKIGTFSKFSSTYRLLGVAGKALGGASTYVGAPLSIGLDYSAMQKGKISGGLFAYRTTGTLSSIVGGALMGASYGGPSGAAGGALIGAVFVAGEYIYNGAKYILNETLWQMSNFENAIKSGWYPGRR